MTPTPANHAEPIERSRRPEPMNHPLEPHRTAGNDPDPSTRPGEPTTAVEAMTMARNPVGHDAPRCGAKKHQGEGTCTLVAGWGTDHVGAGPCKLHGGSTPTVSRGAQRRLVEAGARNALADLGTAPPVADPVRELLALGGEVLAFRTALRGMIERLDGGIRYEGKAGEQLRAEVQVYERALDRCSKILVEIARLNLDERIVRLDEQRGALVAGVIRAILGDLNLSPEQQALVPQVVPRRLRELVEGGA